MTGLVVYYGTIVTQISYRWEQNIPPVIVILLAMAFTVYERGNAQILKMYCQAVENDSTPLTLEIWLQRNGMSCRRKLCFYLAVWWKKPFYWLWMLLLEAAVIGFLLATRST